MHPFVRRVPPSSLIRIRIAESRMTLLRISVTRSDEPRFHPASLFPPPHFRSKGEMNGIRSIGAGNITELCNCIITRVWIRGFVTFNRVERKKREKKKNDDYDKWSAFIMQRSTITTGMQMDRWKNQRDSLISISVCILMSKHAWSYDSNEYKLYCKRIFVTGRGRKLYQSFHED